MPLCGRSWWRRGWSPSPRAAPETLIRRLYLDLTGLPPEVSEAKAFGEAMRSADAATRDAAYEKTVDRLLASPRYGERWVWEWLDAARYADTNGYQGDNDRTTWPWRDWVIRAINANMPYDQFTVWQLAGDLLPGGDEGAEAGDGVHAQSHDQWRGRPHSGREPHRVSL